MALDYDQNKMDGTLLCGDAVLGCGQFRGLTLCLYGSRGSTVMPSEKIEHLSFLIYTLIILSSILQQPIFSQGESWDKLGMCLRVDCGINLFFMNGLHSFNRVTYNLRLHSHIYSTFGQAKRCNC